MLSVIICEDEPIQTTLLVKLVQQWADQCALPVQILSYPNAESFLFSYEEQPFGDILLLDIQMAQMNGMELARKIRERNRRIQIAFLTGLPDFISETLALALPVLGRQLRGYDDPDALLTGVETRSSSPVRLVRDAHYEANIRGIFPCGEGAGYAGGILSAAADGMRCAEKLLEVYTT